MWIIDFSKANCKNCYACVRACPVNAIAVQDEQAKIIKERCIGCGRCLKACPKNAKQVQSELGKVKNYLKEYEKVVVSLAPSFAAIWGEKSQYMVGLLKQLGFYAVEETVVGAQLVTKVYEVYARMPGDQCYITSCCPTVNALIEKHYPEMIPYLIPVISPVCCHSKIMKHKYGKEAKVVFIGPCLSKKMEGMEEESLDAVLTFEELAEWIEETPIEINEMPIIPFDATAMSERRYPVVGGVTYTIANKQLPRKIIQIDGIDECIEMMPHIFRGEFKHALLEMHGCRHSCISGAGMPNDEVSVYTRKERINQYAVQGIEEPEKEAIFESGLINMHKEFLNKKKTLKQPTEEQIEVILKSIGKETKLDELNCGSCGYKTCREKAIAVFNGMAEPNMCLPYMRQKAETLSNVIFEATPNMIIMVNKEFQVLEMNPSAKSFFNLNKELPDHLPVSVLIDEAPFRKVKMSRESILNQKVALKNQMLIQSIIWSEYHKIMLWIANDVTQDEENAKKIQHMKIEAVEMAQQVINKQMTVAQEIASLLGETTAETKVTLTKLKQLIKEEEAMKQ